MPPNSRNFGRLQPSQQATNLTGGIKSRKVRTVLGSHFQAAPTADLFSASGVATRRGLSLSMLSTSTQTNSNVIKRAPRNDIFPSAVSTPVSYRLQPSLITQYFLSIPHLGTPEHTRHFTVFPGKTLHDDEKTCDFSLLCVPFHSEKNSGGAEWCESKARGNFIATCTLPHTNDFNFAAATRLSGRSTPPTTIWLGRVVQEPGTRKTQGRRVFFYTRGFEFTAVTKLLCRSVSPGPGGRERLESKAQDEFHRAVCSSAHERLQIRRSNAAIVPLCLPRPRRAGTVREQGARRIESRRVLFLYASDFKFTAVTQLSCRYRPPERVCVPHTCSVKRNFDVLPKFWHMLQKRWPQNSTASPSFSVLTAKFSGHKDWEGEAERVAPSTVPRTEASFYAC